LLAVVQSSCWQAHLMLWPHLHLCLCRGHFLMALVAALRASCPLEQLQAQTQPEPSPAPASAVAGQGLGGQAGGVSAMELDGCAEQHPQQPAAGQQTPGAALVSAAAAATAAKAAAFGGAPATGATPADVVGAATAMASAPRSLWRSLPTPATQGRQHQAAHLLRVAARLHVARVEPLLAKAHQVMACSDPTAAWLWRGLAVLCSLPAVLRCSTARSPHCCPWGAHPLIGAAPSHP
jgi:hypothetical protein